MASYNVTYACGHTGTVRIYTKGDDRDRKIKWYGTIDCPECEAKKQQQAAEAAGLPALTGSEKQIRWATEIRNSAVKLTEIDINRIDSDERQKFLDRRDQWLQKETSAEYWIDNRDDIGSNITGIVKLVDKSLSDNKSCPNKEDKEQPEISDDADLQALTGYDNYSIRLATKIRNTAVKIINDNKHNIKPDAMQRFIESRDKWLQKETSAEYWIDNRYVIDVSELDETPSPEQMGSIVSIYKLIVESLGLKK